MIEIVGSFKFHSPIYLNPGDTLEVVHKVTNDENEEIVHEVKSTMEISEKAVWTHSILFRLNGHLNHVIGDQDTLTWLESQPLTEK